MFTQVTTIDVVGVIRACVTAASARSKGHLAS